MEREISERKKYWRVRKRSLGVRDRDSGKNRERNFGEIWRDNVNMRERQHRHSGKDKEKRVERKILE